MTEVESCGCMYYWHGEERLCKYLCRTHKDLFILKIYNSQIALKEMSKGL